MRFDYIPPFTYYRVFNIRRYSTMFWASSGLLCILIAIFANKPALDLGTIPDIQIMSQQTASVSPSKEPKANIKLKAKVDATATSNFFFKKNKELELKPVEDKWQTIAVAEGDTLSKIFSDLELPKHALHEILTNNPEGRQLSQLSPGQKLKFLISEDKDLKIVKIPLSDTKTLVVDNTKNGYKYTYDQKPIIKKFAYRSNIIKGSLFSSGQAVGLSDQTIMQLANIFGCEIDFALDLRRNDKFKILLEEEYIGKKKVSSGRILMAEFTNQNKTYKAIRFTDPDGHTGYYSPEGYSMQKAFLRTPVEFTRISSRFTNARFHPILHRLRAHRGVDYAAPHGTPVKAAGDGKIAFLGKQNGYGNTIVLQHGRSYSTLYAHLSRFATIKRNQSVRQGQIIGFVGKTGLASGPHLHYEFRVNGVHRDPLTVTMPKSLPIAAKFKNKFLNHAKQMVGLLAEHEVDYLSTNG